MSAVPGVTASSSPNEIGQAVAEYLRGRLPGGPWKVTASGLKSAQDDQTTEIRLRRIRPTQAGIGAFFEPDLVVRDRSLRAWRQQHPDLTSMQDDRLFESAVYYLAGTGWRTPVVLTTDDPDWWTDLTCPIDDFATDLTDTVLPMREYLRSPSGLLSLPARWLDAGWLLQLVEFAVARGEPDVTMPLLARTRLPSHPEFQRGRELARLGRGLDRTERAFEGYRIELLGRKYDLGAAPPGV